jgi:hypothetical protein
MPQTPYQPFFTYTLGLTGETINARGGLRVNPTYSLDNTPQPDVLIVPGGYGSRRLLKNDRLLAWLRDTARKCEVVASVCTDVRLHNHRGRHQVWLCRNRNRGQTLAVAVPRSRNARATFAKSGSQRRDSL